VQALHFGSVPPGEKVSMSHWLHEASYWLVFALKEWPGLHDWHIIEFSSQLHSLGQSVFAEQSVMKSKAKQRGRNLFIDCLSNFFVLFNFMIKIISFINFVGLLSAI